MSPCIADIARDMHEAHALRDLGLPQAYGAQSKRCPTPNVPISDDEVDTGARGCAPSTQTGD